MVAKQVHPTYSSLLVSFRSINIHCHLCYLQHFSLVCAFSVRVMFLHLIVLRVFAAYELSIWRTRFLSLPVFCLFVDVFLSCSVLGSQPLYTTPTPVITKQKWREQKHVNTDWATILFLDWPRVTKCVTESDMIALQWLQTCSTIRKESYISLSIKGTVHCKQLMTR